MRRRSDELNKLLKDSRKKFKELIDDYIVYSGVLLGELYGLLPAETGELRKLGTEVFKLLGKDEDIEITEDELILEVREYIENILIEEIDRAFM